MKNKMKKLIVVGAGFWGCTIAERIASVWKQPVLVVERRTHIGGNSWSENDSETSIEVQRYGTHVFHTSDQAVWEYVSRFDSWNRYVHRVQAKWKRKTYQLPINLNTIESFYGMQLTQESARKLIEQEANSSGIVHPRNFEEKVISMIGRPLYEAFFRGYTIKQWEKDPSELPLETAGRLPVRFNRNDSYFNDTWQGIPIHGYGAMFERMLSNPLITVRLSTDFSSLPEKDAPDSFVFYSGAIDQYFGWKLGRLEWRTCDFKLERLNIPDFQGVGEVNYPEESVKFTRIHEYRHYHPERKSPDKTIIATEFSRACTPSDEPFYPVRTVDNLALYQRYRDLAEQVSDRIIFGGRLGSYSYFDMDDTVFDALETFHRMSVLR